MLLLLFLLDLTNKEKVYGLIKYIFSLSLPQCLCVSPTYELALQTGKVIEQMGKYYPEVKLVYAIRGNKCKFSLLSTLVNLEDNILLVII